LPHFEEETSEGSDSYSTQLRYRISALLANSDSQLLFRREANSQGKRAVQLLAAPINQVQECNAVFQEDNEQNDSWKKNVPKYVACVMIISKWTKSPGWS
jgi:hypothetical protein